MHPISSVCSFPIPLPTRQKCCRFNIMFCHLKGAPALQGKGGRGGAEISAAVALLLQKQREKTKLVEGACALGSHCSRATPNTKPYLGSSWNKPVHSPPEGKGRTEGTGLFCFMQQPAAHSKSSLHRTLGSSGYGFHPIILYLHPTLS